MGKQYILKWRPNPFSVTVTEQYEHPNGVRFIAEISEAYMPKGFWGIKIAQLEENPTLSAFDAEAILIAWRAFLSFKSRPTLPKPDYLDEMDGQLVVTTIGEPKRGVMRLY